MIRLFAMDQMARMSIEPTTCDFVSPTFYHHITAPSDENMTTVAMRVMIGNKLIINQLIN